MSSSLNYLYVIKFGVLKDSGVALVVARTDREAIQILNNSGQYSRGRAKYLIEKTTCLGEICTCEYGLIMESYTNAMIAYEALVSILDKIIGPPGPPGPPGKDGTVTRESILEALGYAPLSPDDISGKVDKEPGKGLSSNDFTTAYKEKLESLGIQYNSTAYWNSLIGFIPKAGEIIIYSDYRTAETDEGVKSIPGIKIGSGNGYVQDLAFVGQDQAYELWEHINDQVRHITAEERTRWNRKLNVTDGAEVVDEALIFNRN